MKFIIKDVPIDTEPVVKLKLVDSGSDPVYLIGTNQNGGEWLVASFSKDGKFYPNKYGSEQLGLTIADDYNK